MQNVIRTEKKVMGWVSTMKVSDSLSAQDRADAFFDQDRLHHPRQSMEEAVEAAAVVARRWARQFKGVVTVHEVTDVDGTTLSRDYP